MARVYKRDKLGRFASKGYSGQSAGRGARLMASGTRQGGGSRITTTRNRGATVSKPRGLKPQAGVTVQRRKSPATSKLRPGERLNAFAFPESGAIAKTVATNQGGSMFKGSRRQNIAEAAKYARANGYRVELENKGAKGPIAQNSGLGGKLRKNGTVIINKDSPAWDNPNQYMRTARTKTQMGAPALTYSTSTGKGIIAHEMGHRIHTRPRVDTLSWGDVSQPKVQRRFQTAGRVSAYSAFGGPDEFIAEVRAGRATGRRYPRSVMNLYSDVTGRKPGGRRRTK